MVKLTPKALRVNNNWTQEQVANRLGMPLVTYKRKENGHTDWYAKEIYKLSKLYGVSMDYFFIKEVSFKDTFGEKEVES